MKWPRFIGIVDLTVLIVMAVALVLPAREMYAASSFKRDHYELALAEARTWMPNRDGRDVDALVRRIGEAGWRDWAIESAVDGTDRLARSPSLWRALLAASVAYVERLDVVPALDYANRALSACEAARAQSNDACPSWEEIRMRLYQQHLDAGVKSGIDPRHDPKRFREAGERGLLQIRLNEGKQK